MASLVGFEPATFWKVKQHTLKAQQLFRQQYDKGTRPLQLQVQETVWRRNKELSNAANHMAHKLLPKFIPSVISCILGPETYEIRDVGGVGVAIVHANDLLKD